MRIWEGKGITSYLEYKIVIELIFQKAALTGIFL